MYIFKQAVEKSPRMTEGQMVAVARERLRPGQKIKIERYVMDQMCNPKYAGCRLVKIISLHKWIFLAERNGRIESYQYKQCFARLGEKVRF